MCSPALRIQYLLKEDSSNSREIINNVLNYASKRIRKINEYVNITDSNAYMVQGEKINKYVKRKLREEKFQSKTFSNFSEQQVNSLTDSNNAVGRINVCITHAKKNEKSKKIPFMKSDSSWRERFNENMPYATNNKFLEHTALKFYSHQEYLPCWSSRYVNKKKVPHNTMRIILFTNNFLESVYFYQFILRKEYSYASDKFCTFNLGKDKKTQYEFCIKHSENTIHYPSTRTALRIRVKNLAGLEPYLNNKIYPMQHSNPNEKAPLWQTLDPEGNAIIIDEEETTLYHPFCFQKGSFETRNNNNKLNSEKQAEKIKGEDANISFETMDSGFSEPSLTAESKSLSNYCFPQVEQNTTTTIARYELGNTVIIPVIANHGEVSYHRITFV